MDTVSPEEVTTKHQSNVSEIHSTPLIVMVNATSFGRCKHDWYDAINTAEWFTTSMMRMPEYSQGHVYVCAK